jgi:hypothetical protein
VNVGGFCIGRGSEDVDNEIALILLPYIKSHNLDYLIKKYDFFKFFFFFFFLSSIIKCNFQLVALPLIVTRL